MYNTMRLTGYGSVLCPLILFLVCAVFKRWKTLYRAVSAASLCGYVLLILYLTLFRKAETGEQKILLTPFWSYTRWRELDIRWQVYMNVFLFIPLGFMLPWAARRNLPQTLLLACLLSVCIEAAQYVFSLGFCEFDDVFHNLLGAAAGYFYYKLLAWIGKTIAHLFRRRPESP